jgi:hypothetical protein
LSTSLEYFSFNNDKSNLALIMKNFSDSLKSELLYEKFICSFFKIFISKSSKSRTTTSVKLFSVSNQKQPAFQNIAPQILPGSHINLCHKLCP